MQRIMIVSDTHRRHGNLAEAIYNEGHLDMLIHLGDVEGEEDETRGEKRQTADGNAVGRIGRIKEHAHDPGAAQGRKEEKEKSHGNCRGHGRPEGRPDPVAASGAEVIAQDRCADCPMAL